MTENEVVAESDCELSVCCPLDWPSIEDDIKVYVEDTEKDECTLPSETVFGGSGMVGNRVLGCRCNEVKLPCWAINVEEGVGET